MLLQSRIVPPNNLNILALGESYKQLSPTNSNWDVWVADIAHELTHLLHQNGFGPLWNERLSTSGEAEATHVQAKVLKGLAPNLRLNSRMQIAYDMTDFHDRTRLRQFKEAITNDFRGTFAEGVYQYEPLEGPYIKDWALDIYDALLERAFQVAAQPSMP